jgi:hypothetical protein
VFFVSITAGTKNPAEVAGFLLPQSMSDNLPALGSLLYLAGLNAVAAHRYAAH